MRLTDKQLLDRRIVLARRRDMERKRRIAKAKQRALVTRRRGINR